ncbi:hypothetical protein [Streptomyces capitiformicae]|uniref:Uncharacterized protein n=1 Tax=Streptomyces capitiformicae TaxID=2014920 RepID=A0A919L230_9ACTN|nr:hypothetical protein [Streptomyces capitiformicae]GHH81073.1 hypothetical protein GCM10017771_01970 [Streptomyces capitiformicae]
MNRGERKQRGTSGRTSHPQQFVLPDHLPGEDEYRVFMAHLTGCADCGYGQVQCGKATELWHAYKVARRPAERRT